jgi:sugar fermentation stimulation protein A
VKGLALRWPGPVTTVVFLERRNRFLAYARLPGEERPVPLHLPNSGRMGELLIPGAQALAILSPMPLGRTRGRLVAIRWGHRWVGLDSHLPSRMVEAAIRAQVLRPFQGLEVVRREPTFGQGRVDLLLADAHGRKVWVEVKSANRVDEGWALFPDAVTARGRRQMGDLGRAVAAGERAAVVWVVQRPDARGVRPFWEADPAFAQAALQAHQAGVEMYAYRSRVSTMGVRLMGRIPVCLYVPQGAIALRRSGQNPAPPCSAHIPRA